MKNRTKRIWLGMFSIILFIVGILTISLVDIKITVGILFLVTSQNISNMISKYQDLKVEDIIDKDGWKKLREVIQNINK